MKKSGYVYKPHLLEHKVFGGINGIGGDVISSSGQWTIVLPVEQQDIGFSDPEDCTSWGTTNAISILANTQYKDATLYSPRFLAYISGTTPEGNDPANVVRALSSKGCVSLDDWPVDASINSWASYYVVPSHNLYTKALEFLAHYKLDWEWVGSDPTSLIQALTYSPIGVAGYAWELNDQGNYCTPPGAEPCHWFVLTGYLENQYWIAWDSYSNDIKKLSWDYVFSDAMRYSLSNQVVDQNSWQSFLSWMQKVLNSL